jgi:uncharacterized protein
MKSIVKTNTVSLAEARRVALAAQGFDRPRPRGKITSQHLRQVIHQLGLVQLDYVNVLVPAHYQVLFARLGPYEKTQLERLVYHCGEFTEQWAHEASIIPMESWPLLHFRREERRLRPFGFQAMLKQHPEYADRVLEEIRTRGPLTADELPGPEGISRRMPGSWYRSIPRAVLEAHFARGRLVVTSRLPNLARVFDLAERHIPSRLYHQNLEKEGAQRALLSIAAQAQGIGSAGDLADYFRMPVSEVRLRIAELVDLGEVCPVQVEGWREVAYLHRKAFFPRKVQASALLAPFDPLVWCRKRILRLFQFDYRLEIFIPKVQRKWGCYVLPFLLGDRLAARVDLKADRMESRLLVLAAFLEPHADSRETAAALASELHLMAEWLGLQSVAVRRKTGFMRELHSQLRSGG